MKKFKEEASREISKNRTHQICGLKLKQCWEEILEYSCITIKGRLSNG